MSSQPTPRQIPFPIPTNTPPPAAPEPSALSPNTQKLQSLIGEHEPVFILTILPETGILRFEQISTEEELAFRIRQLLDSGEEVSISVTFGFRLQISKPPLRYLVAPWGKTPLFDPLPQDLELEDDGYIGKRYEIPTAETEPPEEDLPAAAEDEAEEEEPQTVDDTTSIFASTDFQEDEES